MKYRIANKNDLEDIKELYDTVSDDMKDSNYDLMWRKDIYPTREMIENDLNNTYLLVKDNIIIGAVVLDNECDICYKEINWQIHAVKEEVTIIHRLCIHPLYRGCGKFFMKKIIETTRKYNQKAIRLDVLTSNLPAIRLYENMGFILQGKLMMNYGKKVLANLYEKIV